MAGQMYAVIAMQLRNLLLCNLRKMSTPLGWQLSVELQNIAHFNAVCPSCIHKARIQL